MDGLRKTFRCARGWFKRCALSSGPTDGRFPNIRSLSELQPGEQHGGAAGRGRGWGGEGLGQKKAGEDVRRVAARDLAELPRRLREPRRAPRVLQPLPETHLQARLAALSAAGRARCPAARAAPACPAARRHNTLVSRPRNPTLEERDRGRDR